MAPARRSSPSAPPTPSRRSPDRLTAVPSLERALSGAGRALVIGMGGGGDVVGALAAARLCQSLGTEFVLGGVPWERWPVDPHAGPRLLHEVHGGEPLGPHALLTDAECATPAGTLFAESRMAGFLGAPTVLIEVGGGPRAAATGIRDAIRLLDCNLLILLDVGGDVLARGGEAGLASPLCDAVMLAAGLDLAAEGFSVLCGVHGAGCDGELTSTEVLDLLALIARAGAVLGSSAMSAAVREEVEAACRAVPTEASAMGARCARGETGPVPIRNGRRMVELTPVGALTFYFDPAIAARTGEVPLAVAVRGSESLDAARRALAGLGVSTELDVEEARARGEMPPY